MIGLKMDEDFVAGILRDRSSEIHLAAKEVIFCDARHVLKTSLAAKWMSEDLSLRIPVTISSSIN